MKYNIPTSLTREILGDNEENNDLDDSDSKLDSNTVPTVSKMTKLYYKRGIFYNHAKFVFMYGRHLGIVKTT